MLKKEQLVAELNDLLGMEHRLTHWQFMQVRRYELAELVSRVYNLKSERNEYRDRIREYERTYDSLDGHRSEYER